MHRAQWPTFLVSCIQSLCVRTIFMANNAQTVRRDLPFCKWSLGACSGWCIDAPSWSFISADTKVTNSIGTSIRCIVDLLHFLNVVYPPNVFSMFSCLSAISKPSYRRTSRLLTKNLSKLFKFSFKRQKMAIGQLTAAFTNCVRARISKSLRFSNWKIRSLKVFNLILRGWERFKNHFEVELRKLERFFMKNTNRSMISF